MELSFAFLANSAEILPDNRLLASGIDFDGFVFDTLPSQMPFFLVAKMLGDPSDVARPHSLKVEFTGPTQGRLPLGEEFPIEFGQEGLDPTAHVTALVVAKIVFQFQEAGRYLFYIILDGAGKRSLALDVKLRKPEPEVTK